MSDWMKWSGGKCPIAENNVLVQCRLREPAGWDMQTRPSFEWNWDHHGMETDIIAYRVAEPAKVEEPRRQHMSDAAWEARLEVFPQTTRYFGRTAWEKDHMIAGTVLLTVTEHDELLAIKAEWAKFDEEWPGGVDEVEASVSSWRRIAKKAMDDSDDLREEVELLRRLLAERNNQLHREAMGAYQKDPWTR
jgi:hypothetical protein